MFELYILPVLIFFGLALLAGLLLAFSSALLGIKEDETVAKIREVLPSVNCGACGFKSCDDYAKAVAEGAKPNLCIPGGESSSVKIGEILGISVEAVEQVRAFVRCNGITDISKSKYKYEGENSCHAVNMYYSGSRVCTYSCLGYGDCAVVCPSNAISVADGIAVVDNSLCIGCGKCVEQCPNHIIEIKPLNKPVVVACSSRHNGKLTRNACTNGCIGCKKCERTCKFDAIHVKDFLASIDYKKCTSCGECIEQCPTGCIH